MNRFSKEFVILLVSLAGIIVVVEFFIVRHTLAGAVENSPNCDIQHGSCLRKTDDGIAVELDILPKPVRTLSDLDFIVVLTKDGIPLDDASVKVDLTMPGMFMGRNEPVLKRVYDGRYAGKGVITRCSSGKRTWQAEVAVEHAGKTSIASFVFEVQ